MAAKWTPDSWRAAEGIQMPEYPDQNRVDQVKAELGSYPPLVYKGEVDKLREKLADVAEGKAFLLQGGDCAESFDAFRTDDISATFRVILQMALVLTYEAKLPVVKLGRMAGQFAKPRSSSMETKDGVELPSYRGDIINDDAFTPESRIPDPQRMIRAYTQSAATLNLLRALSKGGYASLRNVHQWTLDFIKASGDWSNKYQEVAGHIDDALHFMGACGIDPVSHARLDTIDFFTSHEALLLDYEEAMTRQDRLMGSGEWFSTSAHFLWIGDRTRFKGSAHVEFLKGIPNPIGIKCGPSLEPADLIEMLNELNPQNEAGRITLIARFGNEKVRDGLPRLVEAVKASGHKVIWSCDPMHGNVITSASGKKTRPFERILDEVAGFFEVHEQLGTFPGGIHLEMTGKDVTECTGGGIAITDEGLLETYDTKCDPRLNQAQSLELAFRLTEQLAKAVRRQRSGIAGA